MNNSRRAPHIFVFAITMLVALPSPSPAQVRVLISGGFEPLITIFMLRCDRDIGHADLFTTVTSGLSLLGLRPAKPYENNSEVIWQQVRAARSNGQWIGRGRRFV